MRNFRHLMVCVAAGLLLIPAPGGKATAQQKSINAPSHSGHGVRGPLPEAVREATERFRNVNTAIAEGYALSGGCVSGPEEGAMGVHYVKGPLFDATLEVSEPEVLVYEPRNGRLHLVAAEYVVPAPVWTIANGAPQLMGHLLNFVPGPNRYGADSFYELHVWAWKLNPHGMFVDWNPRVSCEEFTTAGSHH
jgi:hypothetical protein